MSCRFVASLCGVALQPIVMPILVEVELLVSMRVYTNLQTEVAVIRSLAAHAGTAAPPQVEFLLQKILLVLASMAARSSGGRSPLQLRAAVATLYHALRTVAASEVRHLRLSKL